MSNELTMVKLFENQKIRACLVAVFENCSGKQFFRTVFKNSFWCFLKKNCVWELNFKK